MSAIYFLTPYDFRDAWFNEGFATFCEAIWQEEIFGFKKYIADISDKAENYLANIAASEGVLPLYDFSRAYPSSNYPVTIYYKGAAVAAMLRYYLGDEMFFGGMKGFLDKYKYGNMTTESLENFLEGFTGKDLGWFFSQWVYGKGWPELSLDISPDPIGGGYNKIDINIKQVQPKIYGAYTHLPVEFGFILTSGDTLYKIAELNDPAQDFTFDSIPDYNFVTVNDGPDVKALLKIADITDVRNNQPGQDIVFSVFPNPADEVIKIKIEGGRGNARLTLSDITGKILDKVIIDDGTTHFGYSTAELTSGVYYLRIVKNNKIEMLKINVSH